MPNRQIAVSVSAHLNGVHAQPHSAMTWERLKEKLRAHGVPGWCGESSETIPRNESPGQLATWENEGGSTH